MQYRFSEFVEKFNKKYSSPEEFQDRLKVFTENVKDIEAHNNRRDVSWTKGINQFSDLTAQEFKAIHASGHLNIVKRQSDESKTYDSSLKPISELPESKDWRDEGIISDVRAQGKGGCYGSLTEIGFTYAHLMGVLKEEDYPYTSGTTGETGECMYDANSQ